MSRENKEKEKKKKKKKRKKKKREKLPAEHRYSSRGTPEI